MQRAAARPNMNNPTLPNAARSGALGRVGMCATLEASAPAGPNCQRQAQATPPPTHLIPTSSPQKPFHWHDVIEVAVFHDFWGKVAFVNEDAAD